MFIRENKRRQGKGWDLQLYEHINIIANKKTIYWCIDSDAPKPLVHIRLELGENLSCSSSGKNTNGRRPPPMSSVPLFADPKISPTIVLQITSNLLLKSCDWKLWLPRLRISETILSCGTHAWLTTATWRSVSENILATPTKLRSNRNSRMKDQTSEDKAKFCNL